VTPWKRLRWRQLLSDKHILAVDLGTSGPKVALVATDGRIVDWDFEPTELLLLPDGGAEQRPDDWWQAICHATRRLLGRSTAPKVGAISCTGQWSGSVPLDCDGRAVCNAIVWLDSRGAPQVRRCVRGWPSVEGYQLVKLWRSLRLTGAIASLSGKDSIAHILFLKHARPEIYQATDVFLEPKDYLNFRLTGQRAASFDSIALHWVTDNRNPDAVVYDRRLLAVWGIDAEKLPPLRRAIDLAGSLQRAAAVELGLPAGLPVVMGTPDVHSAAIGAGAVRDYQAHLYLGTSAWLTCHVRRKKTDILRHMATLPAAIPGRFLVTNEQETAGGCIKFMRDNVLFPSDELTREPPPADFDQAFDRLSATAPPGSRGVIFTPWLYGERTPLDDQTIRGGFHNLSLTTTRADLARGVLEGVALNTRWLMQSVEQFVGRPLDSIRMVGGGAQSDLWCQIHADILRRTIEQVADPLLANLRGAAWVAMVALGQTTFDQIATRVPIANTYRPDAANESLYNERFRQFVQLYKCNRRIYQRLNRSAEAET
jgi:xylulokinase